MKHKNLLITVLSVGLLLLMINLFTSVKENKGNGVLETNAFKNMKEKFLLKNYRTGEKRKLNRVSDAWEEASENNRGKKLISKRKLKRVKSKPNKKKKIKVTKKKKKDSKKVKKKKVPNSKSFSDAAEVANREKNKKDESGKDAQRGEVDYNVTSVFDKDDEIVGRTAQEWLNKILRSRSSVAVRELIEALEVGLVEINDFYIVADELLIHDSVEVNNLGLLAVTAVSNPRSFIQIADYKFGNTDKGNQKEVDVAISRYSGVASLSVLKSVVTTQTSSYALILASQMIEKIGKSISGSASQDPNDLRQNNLGGNAQNSNISQLQEILSILNSVSVNHEDGDVRSQANATLDSLRDYVTL